MLDILESGYSLEVTFKNGVYNFKLMESNFGSDQILPRVQRCKGSGLSFVKCVKTAVDKYGCQKIAKSGEEYISSDC